MPQLPSIFDDPALKPKKRESAFDPAFEPEGSFDPAFEPEETRTGKTNQNRVGTLAPSHSDPVPLVPSHEPEPTTWTGQFLRDHPGVDSALFGPNKQNSPDLWQQRFEGLDHDARFRRLKQTNPQLAYEIQNNPNLVGDDWLNIPGVQESANWLADQIPFQQDDQIAANAAWLTRTAGGLLAGSADPRAVGVRPNPKGEMFTGGIPNEAKFAGTNMRPPGVSNIPRITGPIGYSGEGALTSVTPRIPPPGGLEAPRRFLSGPGGAQEIRGVLPPLAPTINNPTQFNVDAPLDPIEGEPPIIQGQPEWGSTIAGSDARLNRPVYYTPEERAAIDESNKARFPTIAPPRPVMPPSPLEPTPGGLVFGKPAGGEQLTLPVEPPVLQAPPQAPTQAPPSPVIEPPVSALPARNPEPFLPRLNPVQQEPEPAIEPPTLAPDAPIAPSFNLRPDRPSSLPVAPPQTEKPRVRRTAQGDVIDPKTGEVLNVRGPGEDFEGQFPQESRSNPKRAFRSNTMRPDLGFDSEKGASAVGVGMRNLKERMAAADAQLQRARDMGIDLDSIVYEPKSGGGSHEAYLDAVAQAMYDKKQGNKPQEMRVPKYKEGNTGLDNVAMGGANRRTLDVLGSSLYTRPRSVTTVKELLQNAFDEHKEFGIEEPVRVLIDSDASNPITDGGDRGKSITVRDRGRGLMPEEIYTVLTNIGETGKAGVESASGGFGFAKAAPFLGGKWAKVTSVVDTPKGRKRFTFEGTPERLKPAEVVEETRGVPLNEESVGNEVPTGLEVTTWYDRSTQSFYEAANWAKNMTENSPSAQSGILLAQDYGVHPEHARKWLDETHENPIKPTDYNYIKGIERAHKPKPLPELVDTIDTPGAKVNIHYGITPKEEHVSAKVHKMNKGMYQGTDELSYGAPTENVPGSIVADIIATVEEGHDDYPFGANREQIQDKVTDAINKWVRENIITGVTKKRVAAVQRQYDNIAEFHPNGETELTYLDDGKLLTPEELEAIASNPALTKALKDMEEVHNKILELADSLGWTPESYSAKFKYPSERLKKFGLLFQAPDADGTVLGIHIPRPDDMENSAIMINVMELLNLAEKHGAPIDQLTTNLLTTLIHEIAHIPGGGHDKNHSYRDADLHSKLGGQFTVEMMDQLGRGFDDGSGGISPEISEVLQIYNDSRGRTKGKDDDLVKIGINSKRPPDSPRGQKGGTASGNNGGGQSQSNRFDRIPQPRPISVRAPKSEAKVDKTTPFEKAVVGSFNFAHGMKTIGDLGPVLRQGKNFAGRPFWWKALWQQFGSFASEGSHKKFVAKAANHELIKAKMKYATHINGQKVGKDKQEPRSWAEFAGLHSDINLNTTTEEVTAGLELAEKFFDKATFGVVNPARASNRAYQDAMAIIRLGAANSLYSNYKKLYESLMRTAKTAEEKAFAEKHNPDNIELAVKIADEVNQASGRSRLGIKEQSFFKGKIAWNKHDFEHEGLAKGINLALFAPRYLKSNVDQIIKMLDLPRKAVKGFFKGPSSERIMAIEHGKQLLSYAGITASLAFIYGTLLGGKNEPDMRSSDYGKSRFGKRVTAEYSGGLGKYATLAERTRTGQSKTKRGRVVDLTSGNPIYGDVVDKFEDFAENQMSPPLALLMALANRKERYGPKKRGLNLTSLNPFENTISKTLFTPMTYQNLYEIMQEDPSYAPLIIGDALGAGVNVESK